MAVANSTRDRREPARTKRPSPDPGLPQHIVDAIRRAWPTGVVESGDSDDDVLGNRYPELKASVSRIPGARILHEREPRPVPNSEEGSDKEADLPDWHEGSRSYHLFFVSHTDERFEFQTDTLEPDEDGIERRIAGQGWIGCVVGISVIAPFAAVRFDQMERFENGSRLEVDIEPHIFNLQSLQGKIKRITGHMPEIRVGSHTGIAVVVLVLPAESFQA